MPVKSNIKLGSGQIYFKGLDESIEISDAECEVEFADEKEYVKINTGGEATFTCDSVQFDREWTLAYCRVCRQPIPITMFDALTLGTTGWTCPLCTVKARMRRGAMKGC